MLSCKLFKPLLSGKMVFKNLPTTSGRVFTKLVPASQYDTPLPNRLKFGYVIKNYWETIPLFVTTAAALSVLLSAIIWACRNKMVDMAKGDNNSRGSSYGGCMHLLFQMASRCRDIRSSPDSDGMHLLTVDTVFSTHSRDNISRTMDLRYPSVHKIITINQLYSPWPEMQDVLDKMANAEKRVLMRAESCKFP